MSIRAHTCFSTAGEEEEEEDGAARAGRMQGALGVPAPLYPPRLQEPNPLFPRLQERFAASLKALQEEDERRAGLVVAAEEMRRQMLVGAPAVGVHRGGANCFIPALASSSSSFIPQTRVDAEKQKLLVVLEGLRRALGEQESRFLIRLGRLRRGLEEQRRSEAAELARLRQRRTELQAKCRQPDGDLLRVSQILPQKSLCFPPFWLLFRGK